MGTGKQSRKKKSANNTRTHNKTKWCGALSLQPAGWGRYTKDVDQIHSELHKGPQAVPRAGPPGSQRQQVTYMDNGIQRRLPKMDEVSAGRWAGAPGGAGRVWGCRPAVRRGILLP